MLWTQKNRYCGGVRLGSSGLAFPTAFFFAVKSDYIQSLGLSNVLTVSVIHS